MAESNKCHGCGEYLSAVGCYIMVKPKGKPMRYYCRKCAKEAGYRDSTRKRN